MATVFLAEDERLGRKVAIKRLHAESPDDMAARFTREAKLGASLNHPNLVAIFDTEKDDEGVLIVMEYVDGESLAQSLRRGPLPTGEALRVIDGVASALDHAHANGVVHRDVKPANVLIAKDGTPKLVDLGIATAAEAAQITRSGTILGTPAYIAPERLEGGTGGPEADVYSLGVVAFEALSGRKARDGRSPLEIAHRVATEPPPSLAEAAPGTPEKAARVLRKAMAREPGSRQKSAGELASALRDAFGDAEPKEGVTASTRLLGAAPPKRRRPEPRRQAKPPPRRRSGPRMSGLLLVGLIALFLAAAALAIGALSGGDEEKHSASTPAKKQDSTDNQTQAEQTTPEETTQQQQATEDAQPPPAAGQGGAAEGARLNSQGFEMLNAGDPEGAIPILQQAVEAFPEGTSDVNYAYALYNLGDALVQAGRPEEAIPILERRLQIPNQRGTVKKKLKEAKKAAKG